MSEAEAMGAPAWQDLYADVVFDEQELVFAYGMRIVGYIAEDGTMGVCWTIDGEAKNQGPIVGDLSLIAQALNHERMSAWGWDWGHPEELDDDDDGTAEAC